MRARNLVWGVLIGCQLLRPAWSQEKQGPAAEQPVVITVQPAEPTTPPITLKLNGRQGKAVPVRCAFAQTAGGNIDVQQPAPDTIVVTATADALAGGHPIYPSNAAIHIDLNQCFEVVFEKTDLKHPILTLEGRVTGVMRSRCLGGGCATESAQAAIAPAHGGPALALSLPGHTACKGQNLSIKDHEGPIAVPVLPGKYNLHAQFDVQVTHPPGITKAASAEFAPDALNPLWIDAKDPFKGISKKDFGFQLTIKVLEDADPANSNGNGNGDNKESQARIGTP